MAGHKQTLTTALNLTERASELVDLLDDRPLARRYLELALADLRRPDRTADTGDVPLFLMQMALALLDERELTLPAAVLNDAIDTYRGRTILD